MLLRHKKILLLTLFIIFQVFISTFFSILFVPIPRENMIFPGVFINGINVGGMTRSEAMRAISKTDRQSVYFRYKGKTWAFPLKDIDYKVRLDETVEKALGIGNCGIKASRVIEKIRLKTHHVNIIVHGDFSEIKLKSVLEKIAIELNQKKKNAHIDLSEGQFKLSKEADGVTLDIDGTEKELKNNLTKLDSPIVIQLKVKQERPDIKLSDISEIKDVLGFGVTVNSSLDNAWNSDLTYAINKINGTLIKPGEVFSFNQKVWGVTAKNTAFNNNLRQNSNGYCQAASTLYQALLYSGLQIKQRVPHYKIPQYTSNGYDAVVMPGRYDLVFANKTKSPVYISANMKENRVVINLLGIRFDKDSVQVLKQNRISSDKAFLLSDVYRAFYKNGAEVKRELVTHDRYINTQ